MSGFAIAYQLVCSFTDASPHLLNLVSSAPGACNHTPVCQKSCHGRFISSYDNNYVLMKYIPNTLTMINLFLGCTAVAYVFAGFLPTASLLIGLCAVIDFLDGALARWLKAGSNIGKQLDALADMVSFGLAPAAILFHYMQAVLLSCKPETGYFVWSLPAFLITVFSALRLAIFAAEDNQSTFFQGLPTPANGLLIASVPFVLAFTSPEHTIYKMFIIFTESYWLLLGMTFLLSAMLVAPVKMFSLKIHSWKWAENRIRYIFLAGCLILLITFGLAAAPLFLIFYIILSLADHWLLSGKGH
ncbi:MAG: CDP-diacylglycerol--serine O-phosphatidyltransferase [Bacteroidia bacterium]|nr:MAG: CDP-diacylglycerol--serine O-phosphatidyltransferase [Bacteroidia bacterium]